jgi:sulfotransferase family protein
VRGVKEIGVSAALYGRSAVRVMRRARRLGAEERLVFVVGSPRSGTTFTGSALGSLPGFVDLDEVQPWKAAIPELLGLSDEEAAGRLRTILERVRLLGLARGLRGVEQTPETSFLLAAALLAYPEAVAVHVIRDGRDVATSLLERGWLSAERSGADDARLPFGPYARFWVEPGREDEFAAVSDATRAAWAWRRYVTSAASVPERTVEVRYEELVSDPAAAAAPVAEKLGVAPDLVTAAFAEVHDRSAGRWRRDLTAAQLADVEREAGEALAALGYELSAKPA